MRVLLACLFLVSCGGTVKVKGNTTHTVDGDVHTINEVVLKIDVSGCANLEGQQQADCIVKTVEALGNLVELIKTLSCKDEECLNGQAS